jgi:hypothetical protein
MRVMIEYEGEDNTNQILILDLPEDDFERLMLDIDCFQHLDIPKKGTYFHHKENPDNTKTLQSINLHFNQIISLRIEKTES